MALDLATVLPTLFAGGGATWVGQVIIARVNGRTNASNARIAADADLEKHRDSLTFELLSAARGEVSALRSEVDKLRPMEAHLFQLEQALEHLDALLNATPDERSNVERAARAFVVRMRRAADARGTLANEAQRLLSGLDVAERAAREKKP